MRTRPGTPSSNTHSTFPQSAASGPPCPSNRASLPSAAGCLLPFPASSEALPSPLTGSTRTPPTPTHNAPSLFRCSPFSSAPHAPPTLPQAPPSLSAAVSILRLVCPGRLMLPHPLPRAPSSAPLTAETSLASAPPFPGEPLPVPTSACSRTLDVCV